MAVITTRTALMIVGLPIFVLFLYAKEVGFQCREQHRSSFVLTLIKLGLPIKEAIVGIRETAKTA